MSLRTFHIIFVALSSLLMIYMAYWSYNQWSYYQDSYYLGFLFFSIISLFSLFVYGNKFIKKYKNI